VFAFMNHEVQYVALRTVCGPRNELMNTHYSRGGPCPLLKFYLAF
jgi:hypothetical protein